MSGAGLWIVFCPLWLALASPSPPTDELERAESLLRSGRYAECLEVCERGVDQQRWRESWWHVKLRAELDTGLYEQAVRTLERALERFPSSVRLRWVGYRVYFFSGRP